MGYTLGIDLGGTTTKLVAGDRQGGLIARKQLRTQPDLGFAQRAAEDFLAGAGIARQDIGRIVLTGVRTSFLTRPILNLPTFTVPEFEAIGRGGLYVSGLEEALVVSMGTGTALVMARDGTCTHLGGSGIGGGTLCGLGRLLLGESDMEKIGALAAQGRPEKVDLLVGDICRSDIPTLQLNLTAANFGKLASDATRGDIALGLVTLILQSVGRQAAFALEYTTVKDVVLTGTLALLQQAGEQFRLMGDLFGLRFHIPQRPSFATALGAVLCPKENQVEIQADG